MDGTLLKTDTLWECFFSTLRQKGPAVFLTAFSALLLGGKARLKQRLAEHAVLDIARLPLNRGFVAFLQEQKRSGRSIWLATAADQRIATQIADHMKIFDRVIASDGVSNLKAECKLAAVKRATHDGLFDYSGNDLADIPLWRQARHAFVVNANPLVRWRIASMSNLHTIFEPRGVGAAALVVAMRPYQWIKNTLVFVPMLTTLDLASTAKWLEVIIAFACFCLVASGTYILNDLFDLQSDRQHTRKRYRPMASGAVSIPVATATAIGSVATGLSLATAVNPIFLLVLALYFCLTVSYSAFIKQFVIGDVIALAALYTLRIMGGAAALVSFPSVWLIAFSMFTFFSLALIKRCAELERLTHEKRNSTSGRDYRVIDISVLYSLGISFGAIGILVFALYIADPLVAARFATPTILWLIAPCLIYWMARLWIKTARGEMHDDPVVFTLRDRGTRLLLGIATLFFLCAAFVDIQGVFPY